MVPDAYFINLENELAEKQDQLYLLESQPGITFQEVRVLRREIEQLQHRLLWRSRAQQFKSFS